MSFNYKKILVIGATSGIGKALAERFIENGSKVIAVGRRQENLDKLVEEQGKDKVSTISFDITKLSEIPSFAEQVIKENEDLDCVFINSGIQRGLDFSKPESVDLDMVSQEFTLNYLSYIHLMKAFLPHLLKSKKQTALITTSSGLALVPMVRCGNYSATKAALHSLMMTTREQLKDTNVKVIEILPPGVQTELHDAKHQPDIKDGGSIGIPLKEFTDSAWDGLTQGKDEVVVGPAKAWYESVEPGRKEAFKKLIEQMKDYGK